VAGEEAVMTTQHMASFFLTQQLGRMQCSHGYGLGFRGEFLWQVRPLDLSNLISRSVPQWKHIAAPLRGLRVANASHHVACCV
jgi:hypothetical protein